MDLDTQSKKEYANVYTINGFVDRYPPRKADKTKKRRTFSTMTDFQLSRTQFQPTVKFIEVLKPDQQNLESYRRIIGKVGGYSAYFTDLGKKV